MSGRWTPGPWIADEMYMEGDRRTRVSAYDGRDDYYHRCPTICEAYVSDDDCGDDPYIGTVTAEANARLIAAAPDLYAALFRHAGWFDPKKAGHDTDCGCTGCEATRALAKARGEAP